MRRDSYAADRRRDSIGVAPKHLGSIIRNEIPEMDCPPLSAERSGADRGGGTT